MRLFIQNIFILFSFQVKFLILIGVYVLFVGCSMLTSISPEVNSQTLPSLEVPKIYQGQDFFDKKEIFRYEKTKEEKGTAYGIVALKDGEKSTKIDDDEFKLNRIVEVFSGEVDNEKGTDILVAGDRKAFILDTQGKIKKEINYNLGTYFDALTQDYNLPFISIVDLNNDGKVEIAGHGIRICLILDLQGKVVWKYKNIGKGEGINVDYMEVADVNSDGINEVIISKNKSLEIFNIDGTLRIEKKLPNWLNGNKLNITDFNNDGKKKILVGKTVFDGSGEIIKEFDKLYFTDVMNYIGTTFLKFESNKLNFLNSEGSVIRSLEAPLSLLKRKPRYTGGYTLYEIKSKEVKLKKNESNYLAVLVSANDEEEFNDFKILYVYDPQGKLVFQETIQAFSSEIAISPNENGTESLLVTDDGKVNLYTIK